MSTFTRLALAAALVLASACGSDPGTGSHTLYVQGSLNTDGSTDGTSVRVEIREGSRTGAVVTDAIVTLRSVAGVDQTLGLVNRGNTPAYERSGFAWDRGFVLQVRRGGTDTLDAALETPGLTVITDPVSSTTFNRTTNQRFVVRWRDEYGRAAMVPEVRLARADIKQSLAQDVSQFELEASRLVPSNDEQVTVTRTNKVMLQGGLDGSEWTATTHHRIEFRVE
jgi:hypothetical protein